MMEFTDDGYLAFVKAHSNDDPDKLRLRFHGDKREWIQMAINNIAALGKARKFRLADGRDFTPAVIPLEISAQQATSARVAQFHASLANDAESILDMTFGLGMDARLLCLNPARKILGFDMKEELVAAARVNFADSPNVEVRHGDSVEFLRNYTGDNFDLIFIDPARRGDAGQRLYNLHDCQPDLTSILPVILRKSRRMLAKLSPMLDVTQTLRDLPGISQLHIVEESGECKELLATVNNHHKEEPEIVVTRLSKHSQSTFSFHPGEEKSASASLLNRLPLAGEYLYEPSAATMKAAPFNLMSSRLDLATLHPNTHLYVGPETDNFPGTGYKIIDSLLLSSSNLRLLARTIKKADIAVRNLKSFSPDTLRKRLRLKQGGDLRLYAATISLPDGDTPVLILTHIADERG